MRDQGYWIEKNVLSERECTELLNRLASSEIKRGRAGVRHLMSHTAVSDLAHDDRFIRLAQRELGPSAVPYRVTLFEKSGRANWLVVWHQDTALPLSSQFDAPGWGPWSTKEGITYAHAPAWALERILALRLHLDASTSANGPLRVLPGSHALGVLTDEQVFSYAAEHDPVECLTGCGGVMAMRPLLIHASSKANSDVSRRVLHIEYSDALDLGAGIRLAVA